MPHDENFPGSDASCARSGGASSDRHTNTKPSQVSARAAPSGKSSLLNPGEPSMCGAPIKRPS